MYDVIIPCRNEEKTIGPIVRTFRFHPLINQIIVVRDDATTDNTADIAMGKGVIVVYGVTGKGQNVKRGLDYVQTERVILCDGDLQQFTHSHIDTLTRGLSSFVIGVPDFPLMQVLRSPKMTMEWMPRVFETFPWVSGERVVITKLVREIDLHGYLMEVQINQAYKDIGISPDFRFLSGAHSPFKMDDKRMQEMERDRQWGVDNEVFG